ncbi:MAG: two pore domain potassium channel family protein [Pseudomonadota bacterium]
MLTNLLLGLPTMILWLSLQTILLVAAIRYYLNHRRMVNNTSPWSSLAVLNGVMLLLVIGNLAQIAVWALMFLVLGEFQQFSTAFYHSAVNFGSLGYGDIVMSDTYKLLAPSKPSMGC